MGSGDAGTLAEATVVFADVSGFTAVSERLDPEAVTDLMNDCFARLEGIVLAHGGRVDAFLGDCIVAIFGLGDETTTPGAVRAVRAALEIRTAIRDLAHAAPAAAALDVHVGIATGAVLAGEVGGPRTRVFTVRGATVDEATRLEDVSDPGEVLVSARTHADTRDEFDYRPLAGPAGGGPPTFELLGVPRGRRRVRRPSERREATVLFAELVGFERLAAARPPEAARILLNQCFEALEAPVLEFGGVVDKWIGEGMMALFGVPTAIERAPHQALNAAIEMRRRLAELGVAQGAAHPLGVRIGVNTGLVIAGEIGGRARRDFTVMGDAVNLAARLKAASSAGGVYVGPDTQRATADAFTFAPLEPLRLKGKAAPVAAWRLQSTEPQRHRTRAGDRRIASALVGRRSEIALLEDRLGRLADGRGGVVGIVGDAGLGKSRLVRELEGRVEGRGCRWIEGRSLALGANLRFHPVVDVLRQWTGVGGDDPPAAARAKIAAAAAAVDDAAAEAVPYLAILMGVPLDPGDAARLAGIEADALERLVHKAVRDVVRAIARERPLVLVLEDLHWADQSSIQLLEGLVRVVTEVPVLLLAVARPDHPSTSDRVLAAARAALGDAFVDLRLAPLDPRQADRLVQNLLGIDDLPHRLRALIARRAEGNPFFVEEVARALIDAGAVEHVGDRFRVTERIDTVVVPATIQEVILSRVQRLPDEARSLLEVAAVIGRRCARALLAAVAATEEPVDGMLEQLAARQLLDVQLAEGETHYVFKHALLQETVYATLLLKLRRALHDRVAGAIETLYADRLADYRPMLAFHYLRAENLEKAEAYLFAAGEDAARAAASAEALHFFEEALRVYLARHGDGGDPRRQALLERNIGAALLGKGALPDSIEHFDRALAFLGEPVPRGTVRTGGRFALDLLVLLARLYANRVRGRARETDREAFDVRYNRARAQSTSDPHRFVVDTIGSLRRITETDPDAIDQACAIYTSGAAVFAWLGLSFTVSRRFLRVARTLVRPGNLRDEFGYRSWKFIVHFLEGDWRDEHAVADGLVDEARRAGQLWDVNTYLGLDAERRIHRGDFAGARAQIARLTELADAVGYEFAWTNVQAMNAFLAIEEGRLDDALADAERYYQARPEPSLNVLAHGLRAAAHAARGDREAVAAAVAEGEAILATVRDVPGFHRSVLARCRLWLDVEALVAHRRQYGTAPPARLVRAARRSAAALRRVARAVARERVPAHRLRARLEWLAGHPGRAIGWWERGIADGERMGAVPELARTCLDAGAALRDPRAAGRRVGGLGADELVARGRGLLAAIGLDAGTDGAVPGPAGATPCVA